MIVIDRNLRLKIDELISNKQITENMLFICIAALEQKTTYKSNKILLAQTALENGISKNEIVNSIKTIKDKDYPTLKMITKITDLISNSDYTFVSGAIPDKWIHHKSEEELALDSLKAPTEKAKSQTDDCPCEFDNIIQYIKTEFNINISSLTIHKAIASIANDNYTSDIIMKTLKWNSNKIKDSLFRKGFCSSNNKLSYLIGIIKNMLPDVLESIEKREIENKKFWIDNAKNIVEGDMTIDEMIVLQCDKYPDSTFYGKHEFVKQQLLSAIKEIKQNQ